MNDLNNFTQIILLLGILSFTVSLITEIIKNLPVLKDIPTSLLSLLLSVSLSIVFYFAYIEYKHIIFVWYYLFGAIILGFMVDYIATYGWKKFKDLFNRYYKKND